MVTRQQLAGAAVALGVAVAVALLWPARKLSAEDRIRQRVVQMADAAERKDLGFLMDQISPAFRSKEGWTRDDLKAVLAAELFRGEWVRVFPSALDVRQVEPRVILFEGTFILGRSRAASLQDLAKESTLGGEKIEGKLQLEGDGEWRFVTASHRRVGTEELLRIQN